MKSVVKVCNIDTIQDVNNIRKAISKNEGVVACQINKEKGEISIVYDNYFLNLDNSYFPPLNFPYAGIP